MADCIFCKIAAGEIPSACLYDADGIYAFRDINPQAPSHFLVIPKEHIPSAAGVTSENSSIIAKCFEVIAELSRREGIAEGGYRIISNCGPNARQTVPHLHFHVLGGTRLPDKMC